MMRSFNLKTAVDRGANRAGVLAARTALALAWIGFLALAGSLAHADNWPQWRGPAFNGSSAETGLPSKFSKTENVKRVVPMPGPSAATPIVWGDRVFMSSGDQQKKSLWASCLNRQTGKTLWEHEVGPGYSQDRQSNYASPSPATDGKLVVFFYGSGELVAFDFDGKQIWSRNIQKDYGPFAFNWTFSTSPVLFKDKLYLQVLQRDVPVNGH